MVRRKESVFAQAKRRGPWFSLVFYLFFAMSFVPLVVLFIVSLLKNNLPGLALSLVFAAVLVRDIRARKLFSTVRDMAILNLTLWFLLGFFTILQHFILQSSGLFLYLLLAPYAIISGYMVYFLLSKADDSPLRVLRGGVAVSIMIAVISAINGAISGALSAISSELAGRFFSEGSFLGRVLGAVSPSSYNAHVAFLIVFVIFNVPFIRGHLKNKRSNKWLLLYLIPLGTYALLAGAWGLARGLLL